MAVLFLLFPASLLPVLTTGYYGNETETEECENYKECIAEGFRRRVRTQCRKSTRVSVVSVPKTDCSVSRGKGATLATRNRGATVPLRC